MGMFFVLCPLSSCLPCFGFRVCLYIMFIMHMLLCSRNCLIFWFNVGGDWVMYAMICFILEIFIDF